MSLEGLLLIDGNDAYTTYRAVVVKGGHAGILRWPSLKDVETNDWHEYDGIEADLEAPVLDGREFDVDFYIFGKGKSQWLIDLIAALRDGSYHEMNFAVIGRTLKLRATSFKEPRLYSDGFGLTITFADDFPLNGYEYLEPSSQMTTYRDYLLDGVPFTDYGVRIIEGTLKSVINLPDVKPNLLRNISVVPGIIYDDPADDLVDDPEAEVDTTVRLSYKDVTLNCYLSASNSTELWRNYDALLYDLTRPGSRVLFSRNTMQQLGCYYQSCEVERYALGHDGSIGMIFSINLKIIGESDIEGITYLLAHEDERLITTEDGKALEVVFSF